MEKIELKWTATTPLDEEHINAIDPNIQGVYRLSYTHTDNNIYVFYVGETDNIREKILHHLKSNESPCIESYKTSKCYFRYAIVEPKDIRFRVYSQLYKFYKPACNEPVPLDETEIQINVN